jgi:hypothetical protein
MQGTEQQKIRELFNSNVGDRHLVDKFNLFDSSVSQKLWSTEYYCKQLVSLNINEFRVFPFVSGTLSADAKTADYMVLDPVWYCRNLNLLLDGFFMNSMSTLDTLAHEIFTLYVCPSVPSYIYITTAKKMLVEVHASSTTARLLDEQLSQDWFAEFEPFRHCTTHESLIRHDDVVYSFDNVNNRYELLRAIRLPDNPQVIPFTYNSNRVASEYCQSILTKIQSLAGDVYASVLLDMRTNGDILPIPTV